MIEFFAVLILTAFVILVCSEGSNSLQHLIAVDNFYTVALSDPLNISRLYQETQELLRIHSELPNLFAKKDFASSAFLSQDILTITSSIAEKQQVPYLHYFLNLYLLHQKNPHDRSLLLEILLACVKMGMDINVPFKEDPPIYQKALLIKELKLTKQIVAHNKRFFLNEIIARSNKFYRFLKLMYSFISEVIPVTKLILHIQQIIESVYSEKSPAQMSLAQFDGEIIAKQLIQSARLDKPSLKPDDLLNSSASYQAMIESISHPELGNERLGNFLRLEDVIQAVNEPIFGIFSSLVEYLGDSERKSLAIERLFDLHLLLDEQNRNLFHYLSISNAVDISRSLLNLWRSYEQNLNLTAERELFEEFQARVMKGLRTEDIRLHTPLSYAKMRFGQNSEIHGVLSEFLDELSSERVKNDKDSLSTCEESLSPDENEFSGDDSGGWDNTEVLIEEEEEEKCDIMEIWNQPLPDAETFFDKYINTATPVIFRNSALMPEEPMEKLRTIFAKESFLKKYGKLQAPVSSIPYGESFGVHPSLTSLKEIARSRVMTGGNLTLAELYLSKQQQESLSPIAPDYVFLTPPESWGSQFLRDVPTPSPLLVDDRHFSRFNLSQIAGNLKKQAGHSSYSYELQFYLGNVGTGAPVHYHGHAINTLAYGKKKWVLYPVQRAIYSTMPALEFFELLFGNATKHWTEEKKKHWDELTSSFLSCTQHAGDILYVPPLFGHSTLNVKQSIGVAHEFSIESFGME